MWIKKQTNKKSDVSWEYQVNWGRQLFDLLATMWFGVGGDGEWRGRSDVYIETDEELESLE